MRLTDIQNPIANMPHMQQFQQNQQTHAQAAPVQIKHTFQETVQEELTTVMESREQEEQQSISEQEERGNHRRQASRQHTHRAQTKSDKPTENTRVKDGIHGNLDVQA
ncbi:MAG: hypothetical protein ACOX5R_15565 [bacterium]|jgi:hypothetical protein